MWRPDGSALAVDIVPFDEHRHLLGLIDLETGSVATLLEIQGDGELVPLEWSPDGGHLLFEYAGGRGFCEGVGQPGVPTPAPTTLEAIGG